MRLGGWRGAALVGLALSAACNGEAHGPADELGARRAEELRDDESAARTVFLALGDDAIVLDPAGASSANSRRVVGQLFDTLVDWQVDEQGSPPRLVPELLAELPEVAEDGLTVRMRLRTGVAALRFAADPCLPGGRARAVLASDVRASLLRLGDDASGRSIFAGKVAGWDAWAAARTAAPPATAPTAPPDEPRIRADDASGQLVIELARPRREFVAMLAQPQLAVVPPECVAFYDGRDGRPAFIEHPVGSGPFVRDHAASQPGRTIVLVRNDDRPRELRAGVERVTFVHIAAQETALRQFQAGELAVFVPGHEQYRQLFTDGELIAGQVPEGTGVTIAAEPKLTVLLFVMDDAEIRAAPELRRAVSLAFDVPRYISVLRNDVWSRPASGIVPPGIAGHGVAPPLAHAPAAPDLAGARALLDAAGPAGSRRLRYATTGDAAAHQEADILREALRPLAVDLEVAHDDAYLARLLEPGNPTQAFAIRLDADYLDAEYFYSAFTCDGLLAPFTHHCDREYDALVERLSIAADERERADLLARLDARIAETVPLRPIEFPSLVQLHQPWIEGVVRDPINGLRVERLRLRR